MYTLDLLSPNGKTMIKDKVVVLLEDVQYATVCPSSEHYSIIDWILQISRNNVLYILQSVGTIDTEISW